MRLPRFLLDIIVDHARASMPREACGVVGGRAGLRATSVHRLPNTHADPEHGFAIDADELIRVIDHRLERGENLLAVYHSHPRHAAWPSAGDLADGYAIPLMLIVSLATDPPRITAWKARTGEAVPLTIEETPDAA